MQILSDSAGYIDGILSETGCLRVDQMYKLLRLMDAEHTPESAKGLVSQLCYSNHARLTGNTLVPLLLELPTPDPDMLIAVDIMIGLLKQMPAAISSKKPPAKLVFLTGQEMPACAVILVGLGMEDSTNSFMSECREDYVFILFVSEKAQIAKIKTNRPHFFAAFDNSRLHYYKAE
jgi:hypothetical protein